MRVLWTSATLVALVLLGRPAAGQGLTTGALSGIVTDQQGGALPGAIVTAIHEPTGTKYEAVTGTDGLFLIPNVRVGGPYTVTAALTGFQEQQESRVTVSLGEEQRFAFRLPVATVSNTVVVIGQSMFNETRAGTATNVHAEAIETLPTIARSLLDMARTSPHFNEQSSNGGDAFLSVAGRNNRYNGIQIDGAINNDLFGLAASGTPGGQTGAQPISLDAIQELQLVVAPYDVRYGNFSGGSVNAITRSGSNTFAGTAYSFGRTQSLVGTIPSAVDAGATTTIGRFRRQQGGVSVGGPIQRNNAFFFGNLELDRGKTPSGFSVGGSSGQDFGHRNEINRVVSILKDQYGYDSGSLDEFSGRGNSERIFVRSDLAVSPSNRLTIRENYVNALADQPGTTPSATVYVMPSSFYRLSDRLTSTVGQLNTSLRDAFNELRVTYQRDRSRSSSDRPFPYVQVDLSGGASVRLGSDPTAQANELQQRVVEITDDLTWLRRNHTITVGTHNELLRVENVYVESLYGQYRFAGVDQLSAGSAGEFDHQFSNDASQPLNPARFSVQQFGLYAGDVWRTRSNLTLTFGMRVDLARLPDTPHANALAISTYGYRTDITPSPKAYSPRAGFNWNISHGGARQVQVRGGAGLFSGRPPYVWLANQYSNTGVNFTAISTGVFGPAKDIRFVSDPFSQPINVPGAAAGNQTINAIDPAFRYPSVIRGNLAYDRELGVLGLITTAEAVVSRNVDDVKYVNLNYIRSGTLSDDRPVYTRRLRSVNDVLLLTNASKGRQWSLSYRVERPFRNGFYASGSYRYGRATSVMDATSGSALGNWAGTYIGGDVNNPPLATSGFEIHHRITLMAAVPIALWKGLRSTASFYFNGQSGRPYSVVFDGDVNGDGRANDLIFVPATADQVTVVDGTWAQLDAFLAADDATRNHRGQIAPRNAGLSPWMNSLSARYAVDIPTHGRARVEATMDVSNVLNLLNRKWGWIYYPSYGGPALIAASVGADGKYLYNLSAINSANFRAQGATWGVPGTFTRDDLRSRWQMQWGIRVRF